jgi:hypothetical protein
MGRQSLAVGNREKKDRNWVALVVKVFSTYVDYLIPWNEGERGEGTAYPEAEPVLGSSEHGPRIDELGHAEDCDQKTDDDECHCPDVVARFEHFWVPVGPDQVLKEGNDPPIAKYVDSEYEQGNAGERQQPHLEAGPSHFNSASWTRHSTPRSLGRRTAE